MKSYLQGMITGGALVFASIVFMGQHTLEEIKNNKEKRQEVLDAIALSKKLTAMGINPSSDVGTYQIAMSNSGFAMVNTMNGKIWKWVGEEKKWEQLISPKSRDF